jgi:GAF domain-containing protein
MTETSAYDAAVARVPAPRRASPDDLGRRETVLTTIADAAGRSAPVRAALQAALDGVCATLGFPAGHAYLYDAALGELVSSPLWHVTNPFRFGALMRVTAATSVIPGIGLVGRVYATGEPVQLSVIHDDPGFRRSRVALTAGLRAAVGCPVVVAGQVVAVLEFLAPRPLPDDPELLAFLRGVAAAVAAVVAGQAVAPVSSPYRP